MTELFYIGRPVVRTDGRAYGHVITKFSQMGRLPHFLTHGAPLRASRTRSPLQSDLFVACRNMQLDDLVTQLRQDVTRFREAAK